MVGVVAELFEHVVCPGRAAFQIKRQPLLDAFSSLQGFFWHVTDFHYDSTVFTSQDSCTSPVADIEQKPYGDYLCDSPWSLINSSVHAMKQIEPNADFILWTGDSGPHIDESKDSTENIINIISNLTGILMDIFPNTKVYAAHGNHDYFPANQLPPHENEIYRAVANMWQRWYRDSEANRTLRKGSLHDSIPNRALGLT
ncbi:acid sphingomyelinase-like phosphodiesterase 3b [Lingula anatina]|uniref:Acid sphingomyelinase-like phosphodiesterase 3b n=1 Tax=Lingula anatina TaxID=7574 RepID=A0A1S3JCV7_LINAN|nr:acid sphingomyelinase-like phosphodiesterase 3b [Lingula anatina]|eukprot:XP_013408237.1 acid sphingomyelinase-like phosphodiesterase 3b [Lingula anatina]